MPAYFCLFMFLCSICEYDSKFLLELSRNGTGKEYWHRVSSTDIARCFWVVHSWKYALCMWLHLSISSMSKSKILDQRCQITYSTLCNDSIGLGTLIGVFGSLPISFAKAKGKQNAHMHAQVLGAMWLFTYVYLHTQTTVDPDEIHMWWITVYFTAGKS